MLKRLLFLSVLIGLCFYAHAQCVTNVDFNTWNQTGWANNGNWVVLGGGDTVHQTVNANPTFFVSPFDLMNVRITGSFRTTGADDDMLGFVFCYRDPMGQSDTFDTWMFDWKRGNQVSGGYLAQAGMALSKINGAIPTTGYSQTFWGHQNTPEFTTLQNNFPSAGWVLNKEHFFELTLSFTRAVIYVDSVLVFDQQDCFTPGRFGFYNYSQPNCYYSNFQYYLNTDFTITDTSVCQYAAAEFKFFEPCVGGNPVFNQYQSATWNFGDGNTQTIANPTLTDMNVQHAYTQPGVYNVTLTVVDGAGCSSSGTHQVTVLQTVHADFTITNTCHGDATPVTDASTGSPNLWAWNLGDGNISAQQSAQHIYAIPGNYTITLIANNANSCPDTISKSTTVFPDVTASFATGDTCFPSPIVFPDLSTGPVSTYNWTFGDGNTSQQASNVHPYTAAGSYNATLIVTSTDGCADTATQQVQVFPKPVAAYYVATVCEPGQSVFIDASAISSGTITYQWNFGDGNTATQQSPSHTYAPGVYNTGLIITSDNGCTDTATAVAVVNAKPVVDFGTTAVCLNQQNLFSNQTTLVLGNIAQWQWDFGDAQTSNQQQPLHIYAAEGIYAVTLVAVSDSGCADSVTHNITVYDKPVAAYTVTEECFGVPTAFAGQSTIGNGTITQWHYAFGDGNTDNVNSTAYTYQQPGAYPTVLEVVSNNGCRDTAYNTVTVNPLPQISFTGNNVCLGEPTLFTNNSTIITGSIAGWNWSFGDGLTDGQQQVTHTYAAFGMYSVKLVALSDEGCLDSAQISVQVFSLPVVSTSSTPACFEEDNGTLDAITTSGLPPYEYNWSSGASDASLQQLFAGSYMLTVTDANSCTTTATETVNQPAIALTASANPANGVIKVGEELAVTLQNSYNTSAVVYEVTPQYALDCYNCPSFIANPYQTTTYYVHITDSLGCEGEGEFTVTVDESLPVFIPNVFTPNGDGQNDTWGIFSMGVRQVNLKVFNRWGEKVFETENLNALWDGTYVGRPAVAGVYVYEVKLVFLNGDNKQMRGAVTLMR